MMGGPGGRQDRLFYEFDLDEMVPGDHLLRKIDAVLDLSWLRGEMRAHYSHLGCPSICPELMVRMLIVGYCYSIRPILRMRQEGAALVPGGKDEPGLPLVLRPGSGGQGPGPSGTIPRRPSQGGPAGVTR